MNPEPGSGEAQTPRGRIEPLQLAQLRRLGQHLFAEHYDEIARNKRVMVLDPDWHRYQLLEVKGVLLVLGAFVADELVGYSVSFVDQHLHYRGLRYLQNDVLFLAKEHRSGRSGIGLRLIAETERIAAEAGARLVLWHAKQGTKLDALLPRHGYAVQDVIYSKEIG